MILKIQIRDILIENPYETKVKFITDAVPEGFIEIPKITVIGLINFLYVGERYGKRWHLRFKISCSIRT